MGGSITLITQAPERYMPSINKPASQGHMPSASAWAFSQGCRVSTKSSASMAEGTFEPSIVSQSTMAKIDAIAGIPVIRLVKTRSSPRCQRIREPSPFRCMCRDARCEASSLTRAATSS